MTIFTQMKQNKETLQPIALTFLQSTLDSMTLNIQAHFMASRYLIHISEILFLTSLFITATQEHKSCLKTNIQPLLTLSVILPIRKTQHNSSSGNTIPFYFFSQMNLFHLTSYTTYPFSTTQFGFCQVDRNIFNISHSGDTPI